MSTIMRVTDLIGGDDRMLGSALLCNAVLFYRAQCIYCVIEGINKDKRKRGHNPRNINFTQFHST